MKKNIFISNPLFTPNQITIFRLSLTVPFFLLWFIVDLKWIQFFIVLVFCFIFFLDWIDGYVARKYNMVSQIGGFLDPVVDHISIYALFLMLSNIGLLPLWLIFPLILRDSLVTLLRQLGQLKGIKIFSSSWSQVKADLIYVLCPTLYFLKNVEFHYIYVICIAVLAINIAYTIPKYFCYDSSYKKFMSCSWAFIFLFIIFQYDSLSLFESLKKSFILVTLFHYLGSGIQFFYKNWYLLKYPLRPFV